MKTKQVLLTVLFMMFFLPLWGQEQHEYDFVVDGWGYSKGYQYNFDGPPTYNGDTTQLTLEGSNKTFQGVFTIPESIAGYPVTQIGGGCGGSCQLSGLVIPNSITYWLFEVFSSCPNLTSVVLGDNITRLEECFQACPNLHSITFGENFNLAFSSFTDSYSGSSQNFNAATDITWNAINGKVEEKYFPNLQTLTLGQKVQVLPNDFMQATQITSLAIPASVKTIGEGAFVGSNKLESITVASGNTKFDSRNNCNALISTSTNELLLGCVNTVIPSTVVAIGDKAFWKNPLTEVTLPESVTKIGNYAFADCRNLKQVQLNEGLTSIGFRAFYYCDKIEEIVLPQSVSEYSGHGFYGCTSLKRIYVCNPRPVPIYDDMFLGVDMDTCVLYVPKGSLATYWAATGWNEFKNIVEFDPAGGENPEPLKGDVNGDGKVNVSDVTALINIILGVHE
ncbi:MAG: leucine-rich repeat protein [Muribaculaceae bacterium]|nr:leucine-rich repeat protein [Muribaculaceae bacterium]